MSSRPSDLLTPFKFAWTWKTVLIYAVCAIVLLTLVKYIQIRNNYAPIFTWWNGFGGKQYNKLFNVFAVVSSYDSYLFYLFSTVTGTLTNKINRNQISFIFNRIFPLTRISGVDSPSQFVIPRHLVQSITFAKGDGDKYFTAWVNENNRDDQVPLVYNKYPTDYTYDPNILPVPNSDYENKIGVYPVESNRTGWRLLFQQWGAHTWSQDTGGIWAPQMNESEATEWLNIEAHPDNFLARYGIFPDCPLIVGYVNGKYNDPTAGIVFDTQAFANLIGGTVPGGWVGFLNGAGNLTTDQYMVYLYSKYNGVPTTTGENKPCSAGKTVTNWTSGIITGITTGIIPLFLGLNPFTAVLGLGLALTSAAISINSSQSKC